MCFVSRNRPPILTYSYRPSKKPFLKLWHDNDALTFWQCPVRGKMGSGVHLSRYSRSKRVYNGFASIGLRVMLSQSAAELVAFTKFLLMIPGPPSKSDARVIRLRSIWYTFVFCLTNRAHNNISLCTINHQSTRVNITDKYSCGSSITTHILPVTFSLSRIMRQELLIS